MADVFIVIDVLSFFFFLISHIIKKGGWRENEAFFHTSLLFFFNLPGYWTRSMHFGLRNMDNILVKGGKKEKTNVVSFL